MTRITGSLPESAAVVVVGGGFAGLELAKELDQCGVSDVVVLEAGPGDDLAHINAVNDPETALRLWLEPSSDKHFWRPWVSTSPAHFSGTAGLRRRLGGRSLYWHGVVLPLEPWALCEPWWPASVMSDLTDSWQGGPSLYEAVRAQLAEWSPSLKSSETFEVGPYRMRTTPQAVLGDAGSWRAYSPIEYWLTGERATRLVTGAEVVDLRISDGRVHGVVVRTELDEIREISCSAVVLAAGTIENARLAIQALRADDAAAGELPGVVDHIEQGFVVALDPATLPAGMVDEANTEPFYYQPCPADLRSNLFAGLRRGENGSVVLDVFTIGEQEPGGTGRVEGVAGPGHRWQVRVDARLAPSDEQVVAGQRAELQRFWDAFRALAGLPDSRLEFPDFGSGSRTLSDALPAMAGSSTVGRPIAWSQPLGTTEHEAGPLPIGGVLDDQQEFAAVEGLFAAGPSTFPRLGAANPMLTCLALSKRLAHHLSGRLG